MAAIEAIIMTACMGFSGQANDACRNALEAGSKQTSVARDVGEVEGRVSKIADKEARSLIGNTGMITGGYVAGAAKAIVDKTAMMKIPAFMPQMFINIQIGAQKSLLGLEWKY